MKPATARLHILLARDSRIGLVIRHGTAKSVCTLLWDRKTDAVSLGQWIRGSIQIQTCDLSPDGRHFLYTANNRSRAILPVREWTAVSRTPYLRARAFYPWRGGGWFLNNREYCVPGSLPHADDRESPEIRRVDSAAPAQSLYVSRFMRLGWEVQDLRTRLGGRLELVRPAGSGWELRHYPTGGGYDLSRGELIADTDGWDWADMDEKRLVWTAKGCLWAGAVRKNGIEQARLLHDFNGMKFEALDAPYESGQQVPPPKPSPPAAATPARRRHMPVRKKPNRSKIHPGDDADR